MVLRPPLPSAPRQFRQPTVSYLFVGSWQCRAGWAGETEPRIVFDNIMSKFRDRKSGELNVVIGSDGYDIGGGEAARTAKTPFESGTNVVVNVEVLEFTLEFIFEKLGVFKLSQPHHTVNHPIVFTETFCVTVASRDMVAELLFDKYKVPYVFFGVDSLFDFWNNENRIRSDYGLLLAIGHHSTHIVPIVDREWLISGTKRYTCVVVN